jgi:hypothetical protein
VLLVTIGYRQKGGVTKTRLGEILGLKASAIPDDLLGFGLVYCDPSRELDFWRPTPSALLALGLRSHTDIPALKELEEWFDSQKETSGPVLKPATTASQAERRAVVSSPRGELRLCGRGDSRGKIGRRYGNLGFPFRKVGSRRFGLEPRKLRFRLCGMGLPNKTPVLPTRPDSQSPG